MITTIRALTFLVIVFLFSSCEDKVARERIEQLERDNKQLEAKFEQKHSQLESNFWIIAESLTNQLKEDGYSTFNVAGNGFSVVHTNNGTFMITCKEATPYLDGFKLKLLIGNPYYILYSGFTLTMRYGTSPPPQPDNPNDTRAFLAWKTEHNKWLKSLKIRELNFTENLTPGSWNSIDAIITPASKEELAFMDLKMFTNQVSLKSEK